MNISSISKFGSKYGTAINVGAKVVYAGYQVYTGKKSVGQAAGGLAKNAVSLAGAAGAGALCSGAVLPIVATVAVGFAIDTALDAVFGE